MKPASASTLLALAIALSPIHTQADWTPITQCYVYDGEGPRPPRYYATDVVPYTWTEIDLTASGVSSDAVSATLGGGYVVGHRGTSSHYCGVLAWVRKPQATHWHIWGKSLAVGPLSGVRSSWTFIAPLRDGKFEFFWQPVHDSGCDTQVALIVQQWCK